MVAVPLPRPKQSGIVELVFNCIAVGSCTVTLLVAVQPLSSVTVTAQLPALRPDVLCVVVPLHHKYVKLPIPPLATTFAVALLPPLQLTWVEVVFKLSADGSLTTKEEEPVQPETSVATTE